MNAEGVARSNYFKVKDEAAFRKALDGVNVRVVDDDEHFALISNDGFGWPSEVWKEGEDDCEEIDVVAILREHLADGEIAVFMQAGHEGQRACWGHAIAFDNTNTFVEIMLDDIYALAKQKFGKKPTRAEY